MSRRTSPPHELSGGSDWRTLRPPAGPSAAGRQFAWRHQPDLLNPSDELNADGGVGAANDSADPGNSTGKRIHLDGEVCMLRCL